MENSSRSILFQQIIPEGQGTLRIIRTLMSGPSLFAARSTGKSLPTRCRSKLGMPRLWLLTRVWTIFLAAVCLCQRSFQVARSPSVHHETTAQQRMVTFVPLYYLRVPSPANPSRTSQAERPWRRPRGRGRFSTGQSNSGVGGRAYVTRGICSCDDWRAGTTSASFKYLKSLLDSTRVYLSLLPGVWPNNVLGCWGTNSRQSAGLWGAAMKLRAAKESWGPTVS